MFYDDNDKNNISTSTPITESVMSEINTRSGYEF